MCFQDGKVLMIRKGRGPYTGLLDLPGGTIEAGEALGDALRREFDEETGAVVVHHGPFSVSEYQCRWVLDGEEKAFHHIALYATVELDIGSLKSGPDGHDSEGAEWVQAPVPAANVAPIAHNVLRTLGVLLDDGVPDLA